MVANPNTNIRRMLLRGARIDCAKPIPRTFGRGIQKQFRDELMFRWTCDSRGDRWGDIQGHCAHYIVPSSDHRVVQQARRRGLLVRLVVRSAQGEDYDTGLYKIEALRRVSLWTYAAVLRRNESVRGDALAPGGAQAPYTYISPKKLVSEVKNNRQQTPWVVEEVAVILIP